MSSLPLVLRPSRYDSPEARALIAEVQQEYVRRYGGPDAAAVDPAEFDPPEGIFLVGSLDGRPVATGGWRRLSWDVAELKRMFVVPAARRRGIARLVLAELERTAVRAGVRSLVLNTGSEQPEAVALYESSGYRPVPGFGVYADAPKALFYGKELGLPMADEVFQRLHHMQLAMPRGAEEAARRFFSGVLGMTEVPKPPALATRGGAWFRAGEVELHLGVEDDFRPARKGHPGILVSDLDGLVQRLRRAGQDVTWDGDFPGYRRIYASDPFGNRLEFLQPVEG